MTCCRGCCALVPRAAGRADRRGVAGSAGHACCWPGTKPPRRHWPGRGTTWRAIRRSWRAARQAADEGDDDYLGAVFKESLRLHPVIFEVARRLTAPVEVGGYALPAGVTVMPAIGLVQDDERHFRGGGRVPAGAVPGRAARAEHVDPVRGRGSAVSGGWVRPVGGHGGVAGGVDAVRVAVRWVGTGTGQAAQHHVDPVARRADLGDAPLIPIGGFVKRAWIPSAFEIADCINLVTIGRRRCDTPDVFLPKFCPYPAGQGTGFPTRITL